jgi:tetratricopeptide (TPR) repeat protein
MRPRRTAIISPVFAIRLRELREQAGLSLRELAKLALSSKSHLYDFETGRKAPTRETVQRLDAALGCDGELLALVTSVDQRWEDPSMHRRNFVSMVAGLTMGLPQVPHLDADRSGRDVVAQRLLHTARLRRLDDYLGGADTYPVYLAEVNSTADLVRGGTYTEAIHRQLLAVLAEQAQMAGFSAFDAGWHAEAERLFRESLAAARDAGDMPLAANALTFLGYQRIHLGGIGVDLSTASCDMAGGSTPAVKALLHERCAWAHAAAGRAQETDRHLALAEAALHQDDERAEPDWVFWVDHTEIKIMAGRCWTTLRRPMRAITCLESALASYDDTHSRDKALYLSDLAQAYLDANEVERACAVARCAMDLAAGVGSTRPQQRIEAFAGHLDSYRDLPAAADLLPRVAEWTTQVRSLPAAPSRSIEPTRPPARRP